MDAPCRNRDPIPVSEMTDAAFAIGGDSVPPDHGDALCQARCRLPGVGLWLAARDEVAILPLA